MNACRKHPHLPQTSAQPGARRSSAFVRAWEKGVTGIVTPQTFKKVKYSVTVIRRRQTTNRKSASPIGAVNGAMPLRGDFRAFP